MIKKMEQSKIEFEGKKTTMIVTTLLHKMCYF